MKEIALTKGLTAIVDDADFENLSRFKRKAIEMKPGKVYAARELPMVNRQRGKTVYMHTEITSYPLVDHVDGDRLNNQRKNLRPATHSLNGANSPARGGRSKFKGVAANSKKYGKPWRAYVRVNYQQIHLGSFDTETEAALAYNEAASRYFGKYARLNDVSK